jgi:hypothetical protein
LPDKPSPDQLEPVDKVGAQLEAGKPETSIVDRSPSAQRAELNRED